MLQNGQGVRRRIGLIALACIVLVCSAAPVMADPPESPPSPEGEVIEASEYGTPSPESITAAHLAAERDEEARKHELELPPFVAERESSRHAYAEYNPTQAEELLLSTFGETLANLNTEPARLLSDTKLDQNLGNGSAVITDEGRHEILEAGMPVETENAEGETEKVDLSLAEGPDGFEPENPLVEVSIGDTAEDGVEVGDEGLTVTQAGAEESAGRLLGDKNVFYGEVEAGSDTDLMVSPTSHGVELFDMLRSIDSPETLRFELELPAGDVLRAGPGGGAEIVDQEGTIVGMVPKPYGEDAQGTTVPVKLEVEGDSVVLRTKHREEDLAYPILIDPEVVPQFWGWWFTGQNLQGLGYWSWYSNIPGDRPLPVGETPWAGSWAGGLFVEIGSGITYTGNYAAYYLNTPNTNVWLADVEINPFQRDGACPAWRNPFDFAGYVDVARGVWNEIQFEEAIKQGWTHHYMWGHQYEFGLMVDLTGYESDSYAVPCWRYLAAGGVAFHMGDWGPPRTLSVSGAPTGWVNGSTQFTIGAIAEDDGLGVKNFWVTPGGTSPPIQYWVGCQGTYESLCPRWTSAGIPVRGSAFSEGERQVLVSSEDPTLEDSNSQSFWLKVDLAPPDLQLHGQLMAAVNKAGAGEGQGQGGPELSQPVYNLKIDATDGAYKTTNPALRRSGVKSVQVYVDNAFKAEYGYTSCAETSCEKHTTYALKLPGLSAGQHKLEVRAYDFAGNGPEKRQVEFEYEPATGIDEDFILQRFPLPDGKDHSGEAVNHGPELAVNVMNGNVVYHQRDVNVEGPGADLEAELFYNSQLPKEQSSEWGRGWTLSQTPRLEKVAEGGGASTGRGLTRTSAITGGVDLPQESGQSQFSSELNAVVTKQASGGYAVSGESTDPGTTTVYNAAGQTTEVQTSPTASIDYSYNSGKLAEIAVNDPGSTTLPPTAVKRALIAAPTFASYLGSAGSGAGEVKSPSAAAFDRNGNLWVVDQGHNRIVEFNQAGGFVKAVGEAGTGNGQLAAPRGIAFDAKGNFWVADGNNNRLEEFNAAGEFIKAVGSKGSGNGAEFFSINGVAVDRRGHLWVADGGNGRIVELNEAGGFVKVVNPPGLGSILPNGIAVGPGGSIWVTDYSHSRVVSMNEAGELVLNIKSAANSSEPGYFFQPSGVAVDSRGEVWVAGSNQVVGFNQSGQLDTEFGKGSFSFGNRAGIATDTKGHLVVADYWNNRMQQWQVPSYAPTYSSSLGALGSGNGQFKRPADVAVDPEGNFWVADMENNRLQKFNAKGEFLAKLGTAGSGNGQFKLPKSIAFTLEGNFWVADAGNNRLQEFNEAGQFIRAVGSQGAGNGQFNGPEGIAVDGNGNVWVADTYNHRIQELNENGEFIKVVNPPGLGPIEPTGIAVGPGGNVWVADWAHNRVVELSSAGELIRSFGSEGTGNSQFAHPDAIEIAGNGMVLVGDQNNGRIQEFNQFGDYVTQFGAKGSGAGQFSFSYPFGLAVDRKGNLWVADTNNNRIQKWLTGARIPSEEESAPVKDDPAVAVQTTSGYVSKISGAQAGQRTYSHEGELLTANQGPEGTTTYKYDASGRMTKVTLPNGTSAEVKYDGTGRAIEVIVTPAGRTAKWTKIAYVQEAEGENRQTTVEPEGQRRTFYLIGADGGVLRWWNAQVPPTFRSEQGSLVEARENELEGRKLRLGDQKLFIEGFAAEGIKTIQFIVNGTTIVDEKTCTGSAEACEKEHLEWITNTEELPPGTMWIEAVITDRLNPPNVATKRWWVNVPYVPPPPPGVPQPPNFKKVLTFREEHGLDLDLNPVVNELELHERVMDTLGAWHNPQTPLGEVARGAWARWGAPLRPPDVSELEYRLAYWRQASNAISGWVAANAPSTFAGIYIDERAGGLLRAGFTGDQQAQVEALRASGALTAPSARIVGFPTPPQHSLVQLESLENEVTNALVSLPSGIQTQLSVDVGANKVNIGTTNVAETTSFIQSRFGVGAPISVSYADPLKPLSGRERLKGPMLAGDAIGIFSRFEHVQSGGFPLETHEYAECTAAFSAFEQGTKPSTGEPLFRLFLLTAAHCGEVGSPAYRQSAANPGANQKTQIGTVRRSGFDNIGNDWDADAEAIRFEGVSGIEPRAIFQPGEAPAIPITGVAPPPGFGTRVCFSGVMSERQKHEGVKCGEMDRKTAIVNRYPDYPKEAMLQYCMNRGSIGGDSGSPVWIEGTGTAIGILASGGNGETCFTPLLSDPRYSNAPGALVNPGMAPLSIATQP